MSKLLRRTATNSRALLAVLAIVSGVNESSAAQGISPDQYDALYYRHIGPVGNRIASVAGIPGDPMTYYVGAASGGIWKTVDGGVFWAPIFDGYPVQAIGALSVSVLDSEIVWAGTGESHIRSNVTIGNGVWKSTDGGATWHHMGLDATGRISRIVSSTRPTPTSSTSPRSVTATRRSRSGASIERRTAANPGSTCCSSTNTLGRRASRWTRTTPAFCMRGCGKS